MNVTIKKLTIACEVESERFVSTQQPRPVVHGELDRRVTTRGILITCQNKKSLIKKKIPRSKWIILHKN